MWDRIVNFVTNFIRDLSNSTFLIIVGVIITLSFYYLALFLKANKKEEPKVSKISRLFISILFLIAFVIIVKIRY